MYTIIAISIASIITLCVIVNVTIKRKRTLKLGREYADDANRLIAEFHSISSPEREASQEELKEYSANVFPLKAAIESYHNMKYVTKNYFCELKLPEALSFFNNYSSLEIENRRLHRSIITLNEWIPSAISYFDNVLKEDHFFAFSEKDHFFKKNKGQIDDLFTLFPKYPNIISHPQAEKLYKLLQNIDAERKSHNDVFVTNQLQTNKDFFDNILSYPLDPQQREAIVKLEDNTLVISSAGSGKTSTIIGKTRYLLDIRNIDPDRILILTYTRKAANELLERLGNPGVHCSTFHSLAYSILAEIKNKKPSIADPGLLLNIFRDLISSNKEFLDAALQYILHYHSLMKLEHDYSSAPDYFSDRKKYGIQAPYPDCHGHVIWTKSEEEKRICTMLTELGIDFLYEEPYEHNTFTKDYRQYKPDFTILVQEPSHVDLNTGRTIYQTRRVYLEHFAINSKGEVPKWFGEADLNGGWYAANRKYNDGIIWKRKLHSDKGTILIETTSADFHSGRILDVLKAQLAKARVPIKPVPTEELYARIVKRSKKIESSVFKLLEQFITLLKSNNTNASQALVSLIEKANSENNKRAFFILNSLIKPMYESYSSQLKRRDEIDYTDAINEATNYCCAKKWRSYDYILVDEFQDISDDRYQFLQSLRSDYPKTKLFCVGDDWQSIYRFAGSNMKLFYKFQDFFGLTEHCKIETTYRFFSPLLDISSAFVQRNPEQQKKEVASIDKPMPMPAKNPSAPDVVMLEVEGVRLPFHKSVEPSVIEWLTKYRSYLSFHDCGNSDSQCSMLPQVNALVEKIPASESIIILGRYAYDVRSLDYDTDKHDFDRNRENITLSIAGRNIRFMTVHAAKGLEADHIILINCNEGTYGFPSLIEDDPILRYVLSDEDKYEYAEERRVFYVALTRARRHTHILYNGDKPSPFVSEITEVLKPNEMLCPVCQQGHVITIKTGVATNGTPFTNYGCSNSKAGCQYFERVFGEDIPRFVTFNKHMRTQHSMQTIEAEVKATQLNRDTKR